MEHCNKTFRPIGEPEVWITNMLTGRVSNFNYNLASRQRRRAFTLIELLVVIAIIALLTALLFPVFSTARENARQSSTISHLETIQNALALYKLDNHQYPGVLLGYAPTNGNGGYEPITDAAAIATYTSNLGVGSLYPTYVSDYHVFMSEDNPQDSNTTQTVILNSLDLTAAAGATPSQLTATPRAFYTMDGFDVSPQIAAIGTPNSFASGSGPTTWPYVLRYQRDWTNIQTLSGTGGTGYSAYGDPNGTYYPNYLHQLRWQNPPADSYVTSTTYHIPAGNKIIVLFVSGSAIKMDPTQFGGYNDSASCTNTVGGSATPTCTVDANGDNPAQFWKVANTQ